MLQLCSLIGLFWLLIRIFVYIVADCRLIALCRCVTYTTTLTLALSRTNTTYWTLALSATSRFLGLLPWTGIQWVILLVNFRKLFFRHLSEHLLLGLRLYGVLPDHSCDCPMTPLWIGPIIIALTFLALASHSTDRLSIFCTVVVKNLTIAVLCSLQRA